MTADIFYCAREARTAIAETRFHTAKFLAAIVRDCLHAAYLEYNWNGETIDSVFQLNQVG